MAELLDPNLNFNDDETQEDKEREKIDLIIKKGIDKEKLAEQAKMTLEERVAFLEMENERRVHEVFYVTRLVEAVCTKIGPMVNSLFEQLFGAKIVSGKEPQNDSSGVQTEQIHE